MAKLCSWHQNGAEMETSVADDSYVMTLYCQQRSGGLKQETSLLWHNVITELKTSLTAKTQPAALKPASLKALGPRMVAITYKAEHTFVT